MLFSSIDFVEEKPLNLQVKLAFLERGVSHVLVRPKLKRILLNIDVSPTAVITI